MLRVAGLLFVILLPWLLAPAAPAQDRGADGELAALPLDPVVELEPLLAGDTGEWMAALAELRERPEQSRELLLAVVRDDPVLPRRWRLFHHLAEFGRLEDIPLLLERLAAVEAPLEKIALRGAAEGLYWPSGRGEALPFVVEEFSFLQTRGPVRLDGPGVGKPALSEESFRVLHGENVPVRVIRKLLALRGKTFETEARLNAALSRALGKKDWRTHRKVLLEAVERKTPSLAREGTLRVGLRNPLDRPVMLRVGFDAWFGRFDPPLNPALMYMEAGSSATLDLPARMVKREDGPPLRVDMRLWEVHGANLAAFQKLYIGR